MSRVRRSAGAGVAGGIAIVLTVGGCRDDAPIPGGDPEPSTSGHTSLEPAATTGGPAPAEGSASSHDDGSSGSTTPEPDAPQWDDPPAPPICDRDETLLTPVLATAGLSPQTFAMTEEDLESSSQWNAGVLEGAFTLPWIAQMRSDPAGSACLEGDLARTMDGWLRAQHPVAGLVRHAATLLGRPPDDAPPRAAASMADALADLCATIGGCAAPRGELPEDLAGALAPIVAAMHEGISARLAMDDGPGGDPAWWWEHGGNLSMLLAGPEPNLADEAVRAYLLGDARTRLYRAASQIAFAVEDVDWSAFAGREGVVFRLSTPAGLIVVTDAAADVHDPREDVLLLLDLGGDDLYLGEVASNTSPANPVSIAIDLGGDDRYAYPEADDPAPAGMLPADSDGRATPNAQYGAFTLSKRFRQGGARNGIAMLFDLGGGDDRYESLRGSQGAAHLGVGVLFDAGGSDVYLAEANAQGSAQLGIGLAIDTGAGADERRAFTFAQGYGYTGGVGVLLDDGGDDSYWCDEGNPETGGLPLYYSPQRPGTGNTSMCQGAGYGHRHDTSRHSSLGGGLGILRDIAGDDTYDASVFAQGVGYWEGIGILSDGDGVDRYDAYWYVQGSGAHYAVGILTDGGAGGDAFDTLRPSQHVSLGSSHDFSVGVLVNESGDEEYFITAIGAGASNCNSIGIFVDNAGDDTYTGVSDLVAGVGNVSQECLARRPDATSVGIMIDAGGSDDYAFPADGHPAFVLPVDGGSWGHARFGLPSEHGGGLDGEGLSGLRLDAQ